MKILSIFDGHEASAAILDNGILENYYKEERFSRLKKDSKIDKIFDICLDNHIRDLDYCLLKTEENSKIIDDRKNRIYQQSNKIKFIYSKNHHLYHAAISFYNSGFEKSLVIVIDGVGQVYNGDMYECESVYVAEYPDKFTPIYKNFMSDNYKKYENNSIKNENLEYICKSNLGIGSLYSTSAIMMGETIDDCGKAMGLSSYGKKIKNYVDFFSHEYSNLLVDINFYKENEKAKKYADMYYNNEKIKITKKNYKTYANYCYEIQSQTQDAVCRLIKKSIDQTGIKNICFSGGYAMNIIANHYFTQKFPDIKFYFEPLCDDGGISIGAAMYNYRAMTKDMEIYPNPIDDEFNISSTKRKKLQSSFNHGFLYNLNSYIGETKNISDIATLLVNNKSVGIFSGYSESGQQAFGNRSILFNALNCDAKDIVNKIKKREWYKPFASIVLEEDANNYFDMGNIESSPYMTMCFPVKCDFISGITHVDNTCRIQTVNDGYLYDLLLEFKKLTGHGILLNTSFNLAGEPLVETPEDAFKTFNNSSLDYLWFEETNQLFS